MPSNSAAYMRSYRAKRKERAAFKVRELAEGQAVAAVPFVGLEVDPATWYLSRIAELEAEVRHLKAELAKRPAPHPLTGYDKPLDGYSTRPFTPVPKVRKR